MNWWNKVTRFYKEVEVEMEKTTWPTRSEIITYTTIVIITTFLLSTYIYVADKAIGEVLRRIFF